MKRKTIQKALDLRIGPESAELVDLLLAVARGQLKPVEGALPGTIDRQVPSVRERVRAAELLLAYQHGAPGQTVEVEATERVRYAPERLSLAQLDDLERLVRQAQVTDSDSDNEAVQ